MTLYTVAPLKRGIKGAHLKAAYKFLTLKCLAAETSYFIAGLTSLFRQKLAQGRTAICIYWLRMR